MEIMPGFTLADIETSGARIRLRHGGSGPPLLLLHGNPLVLRPFVRTREPRDGRAATANVNRETEWESSIFYSVG